MKRTINFLFLPALASVVSFAGGFTVCSTGFATATTSGCGAAITSPASNNLIADGNWYVAQNSSGTFLSQAYVTVNNSYPVGPTNPGVNPWLANDASSAWITPGANQASVYPNGQYYYGQQFQLTASQASSASIAGMWLADDYGTGVYINGTNIGQSSLPMFGGLGGPMVAFSINSPSAFVNGANVLTFGVMNDSTNGSRQAGGPTPTGFRVNITSAGVPEPTTMMLIGGGLAGLALLRRKRSA